MMSFDEIRRYLELDSHPEGGAFREVFRSPAKVNHPHREGENPRPAMTSIYFLLEPGQFSAFHLVRSDEVWVLLAGGPVEQHRITPDGTYECDVLGMDLPAGQKPQTVVPANTWQAARPVSEAPYALCGCIVAPGFEFSDFAMPPAEELIQQFPQHEQIITELTRQ